MNSKIKDPVSGITHSVGIALSIAALAIMVTIAAMDRTVWHVVAFAIFGASLILLYTASSLYHLIPLKEKGTKILRHIDHTMIYILIAGTYTPFCLVSLRGPWGWSMFGVIWGLAVAGIITKFAWRNAPKIFRVIFYLLMGWLALVMIYPLAQNLDTGGLIWLLIGGAFYSVGALIYGTKWPNPFPKVFGFHEIWHLFVMGGSFSHVWAVARYV